MPIPLLCWYVVLLEWPINLIHGRRVEAVHLISRMLTVDPKKRATLEEIRKHPWVSVGYTTLVSNYVKPRAIIVERPHPESLSELVSYGFREEESRRILLTERNLHPIVSLYHLIEEARQRKDEQWAASIGISNEAAQSHQLRNNSLATIESLQQQQQQVGSSCEMKPQGATQLLVDVSVPVQAPPPPPPSSSSAPRPPLTNFNQYLQKLATGRRSATSDTDAHKPRASSAMPMAGTGMSASVTRPGTAAASVAYPTPVIAHAVAPETPSYLPAPSPIVPQQQLQQQQPITMHPMPTRRRSSQSPEYSQPQPQSTTTMVDVNMESYVNMEEDTEEETRPIRGFFNIQTTSGKTLMEICQEVERVLRLNVIHYRQDSSKLFVCEDQGNRFEIEICEQPQLEAQPQVQHKVHDLYLRRLRGNVWTHKRICSRLVEAMRL